MIVTEAGKESDAERVRMVIACSGSVVKPNLHSRFRIGDRGHQQCVPLDVGRLVRLRYEAEVLAGLGILDVNPAFRPEDVVSNARVGFKIHPLTVYWTAKHGAAGLPRA